jgi:peptidoglycan hydrolase CwlO-like protein
MNTKPYVLIIALSSGIITACNRSEPPPPPPPSQDTATAVHDQAVATRDEYLAQMDKKTAELDAKIAKLEEKEATATGDRKLREDEAIADLKSQREALRKNYADLKASTHDTWDKTKAAFQSAMDNLQNSYDKAVSKISQ